jgi:2-methylcitrate dehydratase PrpD
MVDTLGVMIAGGEHASVQRLSSGWPNDTGTCAAIGRNPASAEVAALVNGMSAHAWDFDDTSYTGIMHGSAIVLPVVLALAQETGASETAMITAFVAGSEIAYALGDLCTHDHYFSGWWSTATLGAIGATAAAAKLLRLDVGQTAQAIGMAGAASGGSKSLFGTDGKALLVGDCARRAILFARTAGLGLTGPVDAFEHPAGFFKLLAGKAVDIGADDLPGRRWRLVNPGLLVKTNPVCSAAQAAVEQTAAIVHDLDAGPGDIVAIEAEVPHLVDISLTYDRPTTPQQAQFSLPYALACAVLHGRVQLADLTGAALDDSAKTDLMRKVRKKVTCDPPPEQACGQQPEWARITLTLLDGPKRSGFLAGAYGMPDRPLSDADLVGKYQECLSYTGVDDPVSDPLTGDFSVLAPRLIEATR